MIVVLFDVDGTLTRGDGLGTRCYFDAIEEVLGLSAVDRDLHGYKGCTDTGIVERVLNEQRGRSADAQILAEVRSRYLSRLRAAVAAAPRAYRPLPGAASMLAGIRERLGARVGFATANWKAAARIKLKSAGLSVRDWTGGFAEDGLQRTEVLRASRLRMGAAALPGRYVGDRPCDVESARSAGLGFVGIGSGARAAALRAAGAQCVVEDYRDFDGFVDLLRDAPQPSSVKASSPDGEEAARRPRARDHAL